MTFTVLLPPNPCKRYSTYDEASPRRRNAVKNRKKMKHLIPTLSLLLISCCASAQQPQWPDKVYVDPNTVHKTVIYNGTYLKQIDIEQPSARRVQNDSLNFVWQNGESHKHPIIGVDSITFYAPDSLMRANMSYLDSRASISYPQYSDDYRSISGWDKRGEWQLANVHDPTVMKAADGYYYMSQTDAGFGNPQAGKGHFYVRRSKDMINWEPVGMAMPTNLLNGVEQGPAWLLDSVNVYRRKRGVAEVPYLQGLGFWAPCIRKVNDHLYRMYYSIVIDGVGISSGLLTWNAETNSWNSDGGSPEPAWIGLLETDDPASGKWVDKGGVLCSASDKGKGDYMTTGYNNTYARFNAIDPTYIITPTDEHWLIYGSWHSGIAAIQLDPATGKTLTPIGDPWNIGTGITTTYGKRIYTRVPSGYWARWQGSEGPEVIYNPETDYYYLFLANDGLDVPYNTRVVRSKNVDGPYFGKNGTNVTVNGGDAYPVVTHPYAFNSSIANDGWVGISHCAVWEDGQGNWFFSSQGRKPTNYSVNPDWAPNAIMMGQVRRIYWTSDGWPVVSPERYGGVEDAPISVDDLVGTWELIDLTYSAGNIKKSSTLTVKKSTQTGNASFSGALVGTGVLNAETNILTFTPNSGTKFSLNVARELDWEATTRKSTIVMAGFRSSTQTYWLKKVLE